MQNHKFKSWKNKSPKQVKKQILSKWRFIELERRGFAEYLGKVTPSSKEIEIIKILREMKILFYKEVSFDMKNRYDFFLPTLDVVIEYDGYRHFSSLDALSKDKEKDRQLSVMGIKLLRYTKKDDLGKQLGIDLMKLSGLKRFHPGFPDAGR